MRVAIDAAPLLDPPTGIARYTEELIGALGSMGVEVVPFAVSLSGRRGPGVDRRWRLPARHLRSLWRRTGWPPIERLTGEVDVVHGTNFVLPALRAAAGVVTVHDLSFLRDDTWPGGERLRDLVPWSIDRAERVFVPTEAIAREVVSVLGVDRSKVCVTLEGVSPVFFGAVPLGDEALARMGIRRPFVLAVGTLEPRKNLRLLLEVWARVRGGLDGWSLVLAGPRGWGPSLPAVEGVVLPGWVGDETLPGLMAAAGIFCYPSLYEGFGLPPLEAMAAGTPALVARYSAAPEVVGEAARLFAPQDGEELEHALLELARDEALRDRLRRTGRVRAATFTWAGAGKATLEGYRAALETR